MDTKKYPCIYRVVIEMYADQGMDEKLAAEFELPRRFDSERVDHTSIIDWDSVEKWLATLTSGELETMAVGDIEDMQQIVREQNGEYTHEALDAIFEHIGG